MIIVVSAIVAIAVLSAAGLGYLAYLLWRDRHATYVPVVRCTVSLTFQGLSAHTYPS